MKVGKINTIIVNPNNNSKNIQKNQANPIQSAAQSKMETPKSINKPGLLSNIAFRGYVKENFVNVVETSGDTIVTKNDIDKGMHPKLKTVTAINGNLVYKALTPNQSSYTTKYKSYIADIDEKVDYNKLDKDIDFVVEYEENKDLHLSDVKDAIETRNSKNINYQKTIDHIWAHKDILQIEYDNKAANMPTNSNQKLIAERELKLLEAKLYVLGDKLDACNDLTKLVKNVNDRNDILDKHDAVSEKLDTMNETIKNDEEKNQTLIANLQNAKIALKESPKNDKSERQSNLLMAKTAIIQSNLSVKEASKGKYETLEDKIKADKITREALLKEKEEIENKEDFKTAQTFIENATNEIEKIYEEKFPELSK